MRTRVLALVAILALALVVIACARPTPTPPPTRTPLPSPTPTVVPSPTATVAPSPTTAPSPTATPTTAPSPTRAPVAAEVRAQKHATLGTMLIDAQGRSLYMFFRDELKKSNCSGGCLQAWPPLLSDATPVAGEGVAKDLLATIKRDDGSTQVTYNGWPLYYYAQDAKAGDTNGQDVGKVWYVLSPDGAPIQTSAAVKAVKSTTLGTMLTDSSGRSLYLFFRDELKKSNCYQQCAQRWPPVLTVSDPTAGDGVTKDLLATIKRDDGSTQVTYNGWPLYYWWQDVKPGDTNGQDVGKVWYVLSPDGAPIQTSAAVKAVKHATLGTMLTDSSGRSLYLFFRDELKKTNCYQKCAQSWPPVLTVGDPTAGDGITASLLGTIKRDDGSTQVTYNGWPLYYWWQDVKPGDTSGQDVGKVWYVLSPDGAPIQTAAEVKAIKHTTLGTMLTDRSGRSLYLFLRDERGKSNCYQQCAQRWPPVLTVGDPATGEGITGALLGTIKRDDGSTQVTYNGWPLYYWWQDVKPGDTNGQDVGKVWYVESTYGGPIYSAASIKVTQHPTLGQMITDASGRSLYLFTRDQANVTNCYEGCGRAWPPLLTTGAPVVGDGANAALLGTITRNDGYVQVTYNGVPLYYYAPDVKPGDATGQNVGGVWFVVAPDGSGIGMPPA